MGTGMTMVAVVGRGRRCCLSSSPTPSVVAVADLHGISGAVASVVAFGDPRAPGAAYAVAPFGYQFFVFGSTFRTSTG